MYTKQDCYIVSKYLEKTANRFSPQIGTSQPAFCQYKAYQKPVMFSILRESWVLHLFFAVVTRKFTTSFSLCYQKILKKPTVLFVPYNISKVSFCYIKLNFVLLDFCFSCHSLISFLIYIILHFNLKFKNISECVYSTSNITCIKRSNFVHSSQSHDKQAIPII